MFCTWIYGLVATTSTRNLTGFDTDDLSEGSSNLYHTTARVNSAIDMRLTTDDLSEGSSNLYHTTARVTIVNNVSRRYSSSTATLTNANNITGTGNI